MRAARLAPRAYLFKFVFSDRRYLLDKILPRGETKFLLLGRTFLAKILNLNFDRSRLQRDSRAENFSARAGREEKGA